MKSEALKYFTDIHFTVLGLLIFFIWFTVTCIWVYRIQNPLFFEKMSLMPLQDEGEHHER